MLTKAFHLAVSAHDGQFDKAGQPYIFHPVAVAAKAYSEDEQIVALLHDVLEDTSVTEQDLVDFGFEAELVEAIVALTRKPDEAYHTFIYRLSRNKLAKTVKLLDLEHNMDLSRLRFISDVDRKRAAKYKEAYEYLLDSK